MVFSARSCCARQVNVTANSVEQIGCRYCGATPGNACKAGLNGRVLRRYHSDRVWDFHAQQRAEAKKHNAEIRGIRCPSCGANAGKNCVSSNGRDKGTDFHAARGFCAQPGPPSSVINALKRAGIRNVSETERMSDDSLLKIPNFGQKSLRQLRDAVTYEPVQDWIAELHDCGVTPF